MASKKAPTKRAQEQAPARQRRRVLAAATPEAQETRRAALKRERVADDKDRFIKAMEVHLGIISYACEETGIPRRTIYNWIEADAEFGERVKDTERKQGHFVERKLLECVARGNTKACTFYLATKGKWMGYGPEISITTPEGRPFETRDTTDQDIRQELGKRGMSKALAAAMKLVPEVFGNSPSQPHGNG